jgi:hypothetical protein
MKPVNNFTVTGGKGKKAPRWKNMLGLVLSAAVLGAVLAFAFIVATNH